jgi:general secretion pathway protein G
MTATTIRKQVRRGFTLVEILIVVIILGILAAIVIPQFTNASEDARKSNMTSQLQTLRSQIELYKLQHRDVPPDLATNWDVLLNCTDDEGTLKTVAPTNVPDATYKFGPYMQAAPTNPLTNSSLVAAGATALGTPTATTGWIYNSQTGEIKGVSKLGAATDDGN